MRVDGKGGDPKGLSVAVVRKWYLYAVLKCGLGAGHTVVGMLRVCEVEVVARGVQLGGSRSKAPVRERLETSRDDGNRPTVGSMIATAGC